MNKVAIIIPVYNTSKILLSKSIDSCIHQTFPNIKIIIVNDGSTKSETIETLKFYSDNYSSQIIIYNINNRGASLARKHGVENCNSEFILFLDADDFIEKNAVERLINQQRLKNFDVVIGQFNIVSNNGIQVAKKFELISGNQSIIKSFLKGTIPITLWPNLYRTNLFNDIQFYDFPVGEDLVINAQIFTKKDLNIAILNHTIYSYHRHDDSLTKNITEEKTNLGYLAYQKSLQIIYDKIDTSNLKVEICINKLNTLYALIILNSNISKQLLLDIKKDDPNIVKLAIKEFILPKKAMFLMLLRTPILLPAFKFFISILKHFKSN
ncbi:MULTISPECIES: glycosyltransferase family 2 protein [Chryseobacterium]|uniref:Chondroitin polymerase n=1 Tax=Chryseobacterium taihuense TaxID=1141221 RepID=A0A4U8WAH5_9FLAO|nr:MULTISPECIES: glycosyltransferase family 2 protein [Chryseobacterium]QQV03378.1 glycosyltransferase family 2 protein [Chryseobacterium sp. FDAARGOS 1104]VFB03307.1 Chondroitin polymerase [Chryseobacterium taihuense]